MILLPSAHLKHRFRFWRRFLAWAPERLILYLRPTFTLLHNYCAVFSVDWEEVLRQRVQLKLRRNRQDEGWIGAGLLRKYSYQLEASRLA